MAFEVGTCGNASHHLLDGQHITPSHEQGYVVELFDEMRGNLFIVQQAKDISCCDGAPTRLTGDFITARAIACSDLIFADHVGQVFITWIGIYHFGFAFGQ